MRAGKNQAMTIYERLELLDSDLQLLPAQLGEHRTPSVNKVLYERFESVAARRSFVPDGLLHRLFQRCASSDVSAVQLCHWWRTTFPESGPGVETREQHHILINWGWGALQDSRTRSTDGRLACLGARWQSGLHVGLDRKIGRTHGCACGCGPGGRRTRSCWAGRWSCTRFLFRECEQLSHDLGFFPFFCPLASAPTQRRQQEQGGRRQYCQGNHDGG